MIYSHEHSTNIDRGNSYARLSNQSVHESRRHYHASGKKYDKHNRTYGQKHENQNNQQKHQNHHHRPSFHSTRLINESAARQTTHLFLEAYRNNPISSSGADIDYCETNATPPPPPWTDAASLLAAEQALEYWANRNNNNNYHSYNKNQNTNNNNRQQRPSQSTSTQQEEDAVLACRLFSALEHIHSCLDGISNDAILSNGMFSHVIDALAKSSRLEHVQLADTYLRKFIELYLLHNMHHTIACQPSSMQILNQVRETPYCSNFTRNIRWSNTDKHHFPNQIRITGVMRGYARQSNPQAAEALLHLMRDLSSSSSCLTLKRQPYMQIFRPNAVGYATVIDAYSRVQDGANAERILRLMGVLGAATANVVVYNATISAWARCAKIVPSGNAPKFIPNGAARSSSRVAAENAERLLREMWSGGLDDNNNINGEDDRNKTLNYCSTLVPDVVTYSTVISAYANCLDQPFGLLRARELLNELEGLAAQEFEKTQSTTRNEEQDSTTTIHGGGRNAHGFQPNTSVYNTILQAYANAGDVVSAEAILESMISAHASSLKIGGGGPFQHVRPNTRTFNIVINAVAKGEGTRAGSRAKKILERLDDLMESSGDDGLRPDIISYNSVLAAWSKSAGVNINTSNIEREEVEACVVGKYAAYEALSLLDRIEERYTNSLDSIKPDVISYNTTISAFANAAQHSENGIKMAEKAEEILARMTKLGIPPDSYSYNGVLLAWSRSSGGMNAAKHAESILRSMKVSPTIVSWSTVVNAYANVDCAHQAEALLLEMENNVNLASLSSPSSRSKQDSGTSPIIPSIVLYNNVLHSWGRSSDTNASRNAEMLFNRMQDVSHLPSPDAISYRLVLTALEHTLDGDKAERSRSILSRMIASNNANTLHIKPQEILNAFNCVLAACVYTPSDAGEYHRRNAAHILAETLRDVNHFPWPENDICGPNQETYAYFMQGCIHLFDPSSEERRVLLESALRECCNKGLLSRSMWDKFSTAIGPQAAQEIANQIEGYTAIN